MPRVRGDEFYLQAKEMRPSLADRFIFITGFATDARIALFLTKHDVKYLVKPFAIQGLINCLKQLLCWSFDVRKLAFKLPIYCFDSGSDSVRSRPVGARD